jgi:hypothetical protein
MKTDKNGDWITSIRIPREFIKIIEQNDLKLIEVFRIGMIVSMYDLGIGFDNDLIRSRSVLVKQAEKELIDFHERKLKELKGGNNNNAISNKKDEDNSFSKEDY